MKKEMRRKEIEKKLKENGIKGIVFWNPNLILIENCELLNKAQELFPNHQIKPFPNQQNK